MQSMKRPATTQLSAQNALKIRKIQKQVYRNRPEMKTSTTGFNGTLTTAIPITQFVNCRMASGTDLAKRIGDKIRVWRIEVRGYTDREIDWYVLQQKTTSQPTSADFSGTGGAYLLDSENTNRFTEWKHYTNSHASTDRTPFKFSHRFKGGIVVKYNGPLGTNVVDNEIVVVALMRATTDQDANATVRMWYTDA